MSFPKGGKQSVKTPQSAEGWPKIKSSGGVNPSRSTQKIVGPLKSNPRPGAASKPSTGGTKIKTKIQTGNPASK